MHKYDDCSFCGGKVSEKLTQKPCWWGDKLIALIDNVPAGVCVQCKERYYPAKIIKTIENFLKLKRKFEHKVNIPLADFAEVS